MTMMTPLVLTTATLFVTLRLAGAQITDTGGRDLTPLAITETSAENVTVKRGDKKFGDRCEDTLECSFEGSICDKEKKSTCQCVPEMPVTNHIDKCGKAATVNESCFFNEQCEAASFQTECRDGHCVCRFEMIAITKKDGVVECVVEKIPISNITDMPVQTQQPTYLHSQSDIVEKIPISNITDMPVQTQQPTYLHSQSDIAQKEEPVSTQHIDPAMIGVLVGMALMFIILCVVLRLFSKARWRENRTIFNTPNPRLMNVSLLRDSKLLHGPERRGSRASVRGPSRQPSMASLRPTSPQSPGSRRGSRTSSASHTSTKSQKSPTKAVTPNNTADGAVPNHTESVTVEIQEPKA